MKTLLPTTRRGALLSAILAGFASILPSRAAHTPATKTRASWRQLGPDDVFQETDVGAKTNPALVALMLQRPGSVTGDWRTLCPAPSFMIGRPVHELASPAPRDMSWWRHDPGTPALAAKGCWRRLDKETIQPGDLYASSDPNESIASLLPLQRGACISVVPVEADYPMLGRRACDIPPMYGGYWRRTEVPA